MAANVMAKPGMLKKVPPPPPSIGSSSGDSSSKPRAPPAPSIAATKRGAGAISDTSTSKRQRKELENSGIPVLSQEHKRMLANDQAKLKWLFGRGPSMDLSYDAMVLGRVLSQVEPELYVDTTFCRAHILQQLMDVKYDILGVNKERFFEVRNKMVTFDRMFGKDTWYSNSDFIKMANLDALMDFQLSQPRNSRNENLVEPNGLLYFADICGGPGGFAEYILWKKQWNARGFGFTSRKSDYVLPSKPHYPKECFETIYGFYDLKGNGDIMNPEEINWFVKHCRKVTGRKGVHVAIANGGDASEGDEDKKELKCKYMFLAEVMVALSIVREGGHFVLRMYDMFTPFTVGLLFFLHQMFDSVAVHKTETTMVASSERYVICKWRKTNRFTREVLNFFTDCQKFFKNTQRMQKNADSQMADIQELVPVHTMRNNQRFMSFILEVNEVYGIRQLDETRKINEEIKRQGTQNLIRQHMVSIHKKATTLWGIPKTFSVAAKYSDAGTPEIRAAKLCLPYTPETFNRIDKEGEQELNFTTLEDELSSPSEWHVFLVGRDRGFFLGLGEAEVYRYHGGTWNKCVDKLELAANSLVYGDLVDEISIHECRQVTTTGFHIIDAMILGGKDIRNLPHSERLELCCKFARAMDKPNRQDLAAIRAKVPHELPKMELLLKRVLNQRLKGGGHGPTKEATFPVDGAKFFEDSKMELVFKPSGALLVKTLKQNCIPGDFLFAMQNRLIWRWQENVSLELVNEEALEDAKEKHGPIHAATIVQFLKAEI